MCGFYAEAASRDMATSDELEELRWFTPEELTTAVLTGDILLSPPVSIAFQLLAGWFRTQGGGELVSIYRQALEARRAGTGS
jgi:NADH pyrophosphatase NudC (nudix superfamily)